MSQPELIELVNALEDLSADEVRYMCVKLGVEQSTLDKIDADYRESLTRVPKYLEAWLDHESHPSWAKLVEVLKSKRLNKSVLASRIRREHCPSDAPEGLSSPSSNNSSRLSSMDYSNQEAFPLNDSVDQAASVQEFQQVLQLALTSQPAVLPTGESRLARGTQIVREAAALAMKFISVVNHANVYLTETERTPKELQLFKVDLTRLPLLKRYKRLLFLRKKKKRIIRAESIQEVFDILDPYWNYVDYSLLEHIVRKYCNKSVKKRMKRYVSKLDKFERATSVKDFASALPHNRKFPRELIALTAELNIDAAECTLHRIRKIKESIAENACLEPYVVYMRDLHASSVVLAIAFPRTARKHVEQSLDDKFLQSLGIIPESVHFDETQPIRDPRTLVKGDIARASADHELSSSNSSVQEERHTAAMFPQDNREEFYTIKRRDLKPVYRNSGPQLVRKYCDEIEFITRNAKISIYIQWKPEQVDFRIAGLQEGVPKALHFIRKEFLPPEKAQRLRSESEKYKAAPMSVDEQRDLKLQSQRNPVLLTKEALREHERLTSPKELRQFACSSCNHVWWRVVLSIKAVSRCKQCNVRYDALPHNKEYGIGRFVCPNEKCGKIFFGRCHADSKWKCYGCDIIVGKPYIHPSNEKHRPISKYRARGDHYCGECLGEGKCPLSKRVLYASKPHVSTGSTIDTWLSQTGSQDYPFYTPLYGSPSQLSPIRERSADSASCTTTHSHKSSKSSRSSRSAQGSRSSRD